MISDTLTEEVLSLEEEVRSRSPTRSRTSSSSCGSCSSETVKLDGKTVAATLLQLSRDNIILAVYMKAPKKVAIELNKSHLFIQNRFRAHLTQTIFPQIIGTVAAASMSTSAVPSTSCTVLSTTHNLPPITIDFKKFIDELEDLLGQSNQIPVIQASTEARAITLFIASVETIMESKGFQPESIFAVKKQLLTIQAQFLHYLANVDGNVRINEIMRYCV